MVQTYVCSTQAGTGLREPRGRGFITPLGDTGVGFTPSPPQPSSRREPCPHWAFSILSLSTSPPALDCYFQSFFCRGLWGGEMLGAASARSDAEQEVSWDMGTGLLTQSGEGKLNSQKTWCAV